MTQIETADEAQQQPPRVYAEDFPEAVVDGVEKFFAKPRARGWIHVYAAIVAFIAGAALMSVSWSMESTRAGLATLLYTFTIVAMFAVSGTYSPGELAVKVRTQVDEASRPLDDLRLHRGQLYAVRPAGIAVGEGLGAVLDRLGRGDRGCSAQDVLALGATLGRCAAVSAAGLGGGMVRRADHGGRGRRGAGAADRRWVAATASAVCSMGSSGRIRGPRRSATTSSSTPAPRLRRSATTSRCGSRSSSPA